MEEDIPPRSRPPDNMPVVRVSADQVEDIAYRLSQQLTRQYREIASDWAWGVRSIALTSMPLGTAHVPVYQVKIARWRSPTIFRRGGIWSATLQIDPETGRLVGWQDHGMKRT